MIILEIIIAAEVLCAVFLLTGLIVIELAKRKFVASPHLAVVLYELGHGMISISVLASVFFGIIYVWLV
jgi:hypothetical protein